MIAVQNLSKRFHHTIAVNDVSFEVEEGKTLVLLGTSGSGKTTTLRMINRLIEPTSGTILINGESIFSKQPEMLRRSIGYVLQHHGLFPHYTVAHNIMVVPLLLKWPKEKAAQRAAELLEKLQLPPRTFLNMYPDSLSGGQKQRVGLARALAGDPPLLLMDEPFGALDPVTRTGIRNELKTLDELSKKTVILVTHDVQEAFELGDAICLMDNGAVVQMGTPADLLFRPATVFVSKFFEHQRLSLELRSVTLKSIWPILGDAAERDAVVLDSSKTLWDAIEVLANGTESVVVADGESRTRKRLTFGAIQAALKKQNHTR
jgi:osmoprotectant transport system ATP-binding protein